MFNQVFLIGRLTDLPNAKQAANIDHDTIIHIDVYKPYDGYDDHQPFVKVPVVVWQGMAKKILTGAKVGSFLAIKGRLLNKDDNPQEGIYIRGETVKVLDYDLLELVKGDS